MPRRSQASDPIVGAVLREERLEQGRSQEAVAHDAGITTGTLGRVERGAGDNGWSTIVAVADALGVSLEELGRRIDARRT